MKTVPVQPSSLDLPPCSAHSGIRHDGDCLWLMARDQRAGGLAVLGLAAVLAVTQFLAWQEPHTTSNLKLGLLTALFTVIITLPLAVGGLLLLFRHPCDGMLEPARQRVHRVRYRSGMLRDSRACASLYLVVEFVDNDDLDSGPGVTMYACDQPRIDAPWRVRLWENFDSPADSPRALRELTRCFRWKDVAGDPGAIEQLRAH